jgi:hypothetical protein
VSDAGQPPLIEAIAGAIAHDADGRARREAMGEGSVRLDKLCAPALSLPEPD